MDKIKLNRDMSKINFNGNRYNGDLTSKEADTVGGYMLKKMIEKQEQQIIKNDSNNK